MDYTLKGSLAKHLLRPYLAGPVEDTTFRPTQLPGPRPKGASLEEALYEVVDKRCQASRQTPTASWALDILRSAYRKAREREGGLNGRPLPVASPLVRALVRRHVSDLMSREGRHREAFMEAQEALRYADAALRALLESVAEMPRPQEAEAEAAPAAATTPTGGLKSLLAAQPQLLVETVALAVQTRRALAREMAFFARGRKEGEQPQATAPFSEEDYVLPPSPPSTARGEPSMMGPPRAPQAAAAAAQLRREADLFAECLLPPGHPERSAGEVPSVEASERAPDQRKAMPRTIDTLDEESKRELLTLQKVLRNASEATYGPLRVPVGQRPLGQAPRGTWQPSPGTKMYGSAPPGDVFAHSLPAIRCSSKGKMSRRRTTKQAPAKVSPPTPKGIKLPEEPPPYVDPFTDWKQSFVEEMKLTHLKVQSFEGQREVKEELKYHDRMFKFVELEAIKALGEDRLYENRMFFSGFGMYVRQKQKRREEEWQAAHHPPTDRELLRQQEERRMFEEYGMPLPRGRSEPTLKELRKLLYECHERSEVVKEQRRREEEERRLAEEQRKIEAELDRQRLVREKLSGMEVGHRPGESIFRFTL